MKSNVLSPVFWVLVLTIFVTVQSQQGLFDISCAVVQKKVCVNLGGGSDTIDEYVGDAELVTYMNLGGSPTQLLNYDARIGDTDSFFAFARQMSHPRSVSCFVGVDIGWEYDIELGFAHIDTCEGEGVSLKNQSEGSESPEFNVLKDAGCRKAYFVKLSKLIPLPWKSPNLGKLAITVSKIAGVGPTTVATLCAYQTIPSRNVQCSQSGCTTLTGKYGYANAYGHGCKNGEDYAILSVPNSARVVKSFIRWSGLYEDKKKISRIFVNDNKITPTQATVIGDIGIYVADITKMMSKAGFLQPYKINGFNSIRCKDTAWNIVTIYQDVNLPIANINLCTTPRSGNAYPFQIRCINSRLTNSAMLYAHFTETDWSSVSAKLFINSKLAATKFMTDNVGAGSNFLSLDVSEGMKDSEFFFNITKVGVVGKEYMPIVDLVEIL